MSTKKMRIVLFYSEVEAFNFFTDCLAEELQARGHETFILDLPNKNSGSKHSLTFFVSFLAKKVDAVICFDGLGIQEDIFIDILNEHHAVVADILLDPPLRFHTVFQKHPQNHCLFCCDKDHMEYVRKYFGHKVETIVFMPHAGVLPPKSSPVIPYSDKRYDLLFTGTYYHYQNKFQELETLFSIEKDTPLYLFYQQMFLNLVKDNSLTIDQAFHTTLKQFNWSLPDDQITLMLSFTESVDWAIRMYQRERVITTLVEAGFQIHLLGRGWENYSLVNRPNVHHIDKRIPFVQTLPYMADARLCLNVFPWFKSGTHERIFTTFLTTY